MLFWFYRRARRAVQASPAPGESRSEATDSGAGLAARRVAFVLVLLLPLAIPSDWTQDVPARYGDRHPGMQRSWLYPPIAAQASE